LAFSIREKVAESRMRESLQAFHFPDFLSTATIPHPPLTWSLLSQLGEGFLNVLLSKIRVVRIAMNEQTLASMHVRARMGDFGRDSPPSHLAK
jgi:hypothetical protein